LNKLSAEFYTLRVYVNVSAGVPIERNLRINVQRNSNTACVVIDTGLQGSQVIQVAETTPSGTVIANITTGSDTFGVIVYTIDDTTNFQIDQNTGALSIRNQLNYEDKSLYPIVVTAQDTTRGSSNSITLFVQVLNINEFSPVINTPSSGFTVTELTNIGGYVGRINAEDSDGDTTLTYTISSGNPDGIFKIDSTDGTITLDKKATPGTHILSLCANDGSELTCKNISITVTEANDEAPKFSQLSVNVAISEPYTNNKTVYQSVVTDGDGSAITYRIDSNGNSDVDSFFGVDASGRIFIASTPTPGTYNYLLCASDGFFESCQLVSSIVSKTGTVAPVFQPSNYGGVVSSNATAGTRIVQVYAETVDKANLVYSITVPSPSNRFAIDGANGFVSVKNPTLLESGKVYTLTVRAARRDDSARYEEVNITIAVSNPQYNAGSYIAQVINNQMIVNFSLGSFDNDQVAYYIIYGQELFSSEGSATPAVLAELDAKANLPPVSWYYVNKAPNYANRRYYIANVTASDVVDAQNDASNRKRRSIQGGSPDTFTYKVGVAEGCGNQVAEKAICNGPLKVGVAYRYNIQAVYKNGDVATVPIDQQATNYEFTKSPQIGKSVDGYMEQDSYIITFWIIGLVIFGLLFWFAVLAIAILLCYKRRYRVDAAYGYSVAVRADRIDGPPQTINTNYYKIHENYQDNDTVKMKKSDEGYNSRITETQTSSMVILDDYEQSPRPQHKDYETRSATIKFTEESPEWESMDIQLRIDPTGKQDPIITRKEHTDDDMHKDNSSDASYDKGDYDDAADYQKETTTYHTSTTEYHKEVTLTKDIDQDDQDITRL